MNNYERRKSEIRQEAIEWQTTFNDCKMTYGELAIMQSYFEKQGKRYGLLKEFKENGII